MKNILFTLIVFGIIGCATNYAHLSRTEEMLISGYTIQEIEKAKQSGTFNMLVSRARSSGVSQRALEQYQYSASMQNKIARYRESKRQYEYYAQQQAIAKKAREQEEQRRRIAQAQQARYENYINEKRSRCISYGYKGDNAIASCVQQEINNERVRLNALQAQANAQAQADYQRRMDSLSSMGRCLTNEGSFANCANAWQGYTPPPPKKEYRCEYDVFGNQITSTCREQ